MDTISGFKKRFEALEGIEELLSVAAPQYQSPEVYFKELIADEKDKTLAEKRLRILEDMLVREKSQQVKIALERLRRERDIELQKCDWTQLPDAPLEQVEKKNYRKYREYLRNLPDNIKKGVLKSELLEYSKWKKWIESVKNIPGYESFIP